MSSCHCVDVAPGSYANQVSMLAPFEFGNRDDRWVCIDTCIATEIGWLWHHGVHTLNSCCGHQQQPASVIVAPGSYDLMDTLGYEWELAPSGMRAHHLKGAPSEPQAAPSLEVADDIRAQERERIAVSIEAHAKDGADYGAAWSNNRGYYSGLMGAALLARAEEVGK